jgi:hypothetical protein
MYLDILYIHTKLGLCHKFRWFPTQVPYLCVCDRSNDYPVLDYKLCYIPPSMKISGKDDVAVVPPIETHVLPV